MKLWARLGMGLLPLALLAVLGTAWVERRAAFATLEERAAEQARALASSSAVPEAVRGLRLRSEELLLPVLQLTLAGGAREASALLPDGTVLSHTDVARVGKRAPDEALQAALQSGRPVRRVRGHDIEVTVPVHEEGEAEEFLLDGRSTHALGALRVIVPLGPARATASLITRRGALLSAALTILIAAVGLLWLRKALVPLDALAEAAGRVGGGELGASVPVQGFDEVADLARRFNAMSVSLRETTVSRAFVSSVVDAMPDALLVADRAGLVRLANPAARELLGGEPAGKPLGSIFPAPPEPGKGFELELSGVPLLCGAASLPGGGLVVTLRDISGRKRAEQELARSNAELEQFAFIASHDLQEPLRKVASYCQLVQRRYAGKLDKEADDFLGYAVEGASRMKSLINDLLAYSRVGRGGQTFEPVDLNETVRASLDALQEAVRESGAEIEVENLPTLQGHPPSLRQLFQNLIGNAVKFRRADRPVRVTVSAQRRGGEWLFTIADNGIGIEPRHLERVFEIFQRLHAKSVYPGTGIGLAICRRVVETHGGRIWAESKPGDGSAFKFTLPERRDG